MRRQTLLLIVGVFCWHTGLFAQQQAQYTQFMFNKLWMNPGYAGTGTLPCLNIITRNQWLGFDGAPVSQSLNFHSPLKKQRVGLGVSLNHDKIGPTNSWTLTANYAYRIPTKIGRLSVGIQGSLTDYGVNFSELQGLQSGDGYAADDERHKTLTNFGAGVYFTTKKYFAGISLPFMIRNDISFTDDVSSSVNRGYGQQEIHWYLMAGAVIRVSNTIRFKPAFLYKYANNAPSDLDINGSFIFLDRLWAGLSYRLGGSTRDSFGESIDIILQYQMGNGMRIGTAYDFSLTELQNHNNGSIEFMLQYCFYKKSEEVTNPRFF